jgi:hypothetical protein
LLAGVVVLTVAQFGKVSREKEIVADVYEIGKIVPSHSSITVPEGMYDEYNFILEGFLVRYFNISLDPYEMQNYFLTEKPLRAPVPDDYEKVHTNLLKHELYRRSTGQD